MSDPVIQVSGLTKRFGATTAVDALSFTVARGEILGLGIADLLGRVTGALSSGQLTRLNLCKAFLNDPEVPSTWVRSATPT